MKYSLAENAASSLHIAIEHFKTFFYKKDKLSVSLLNENIKISLTFLENAIELLLKTILVSDDETAIYAEPESKAIKQALSAKASNKPLSDVLISKGNVKTITYTEAVEEYNKKYSRSNKLYNILHQLGEKRNQITHLGIEILKYDEILVLFFNVFDVIYNYLYPQLIELDEIGDYFTSDDFLVKTIHGVRFLFDEDLAYNNIVDFLDELLGDLRGYFCAMRARNPDTKICAFNTFFQGAISDTKFQALCENYKVSVDFSMCHYEDHDYSIEVIGNDDVSETMLSRYLPYYNATVFEDVSGNIMFVVLHYKGEMYIYNQCVSYPADDEPEADDQWINDMNRGCCEKVTLSKRNILKVFELFFERFQTL